VLGPIRHPSNLARLSGVVPIAADYATFPGTIADGQEGRRLRSRDRRRGPDPAPRRPWENVVPYVQPTPGTGVFEPVAPTTPIDVVLTQVQRRRGLVEGTAYAT
jgi:hypothetical protein